MLRVGVHGGGRHLHGMLVLDLYRYAQLWSVYSACERYALSVHGVGLSSGSMETRSSASILHATLNYCANATRRRNVSRSISLGRRITDLLLISECPSCRSYHFPREAVKTRERGSHETIMTR